SAPMTKPPVNPALVHSFIIKTLSHWVSASLMCLCPSVCVCACLCVCVCVCVCRSMCRVCLYIFSEDASSSPPFVIPAENKSRKCSTPFPQSSSSSYRQCQGNRHQTGKRKHLV